MIRDLACDHDIFAFHIVVSIIDPTRLNAFLVLAQMPDEQCANRA
jgi:hypothetical protein